MIGTRNKHIKSNINEIDSPLYIHIKSQDSNLVHSLKKPDLRVSTLSQVTTRAPARVSFAGGGSDTTYFLKRLGSGCVFNTAINKYVTCRLSIRDDQSFRIVNHTTDEDIFYKEYQDLQEKNDIISRALSIIEPNRGLNIELKTDFPIGSGLGGSSAILIALIGGINYLQNFSWSNNEVIKLAFYIERVVLGISGGWQDYIASIYGGFNHIQFSQNNFSISPAILNPHFKAKLENNLFLCHTKSNHHSGNIHIEQEREFLSSLNSFESMKTIKELSEKMKHAFEEESFSTIGQIINAGWELKKNSCQAISSKQIDEVYNYGLKAGAIAGRLLGAGGGGYFLFITNDQSRSDFIKEMTKLDFPVEEIQLESHGMTYNQGYIQ